MWKSHKNPTCRSEILAHSVDEYSKNYTPLLRLPFCFTGHHFVVKMSTVLTQKLVFMPDRGQNENLDRHLQDNRGMNPMDQQNEQVSQQRDTSDSASGGSQRKGTANRGFAAMDPERQRRIASEGGRAAHRQGVAHEWSKEEAREAGRKGGQKVSQNREHMSEIGRKGGQSSGNRRSRTSGEQ